MATTHESSENAILNRLSIATSLLARQREKSLLNMLTYRDEKWIYFDNLKQRKSWLIPAIYFNAEEEYSWAFFYLVGCT